MHRKNLPSSARPSTAPSLSKESIYRNRSIFYDLRNLVFQTVTKPKHYLDEV